jgi:co-chaperonin GroES (HSP10)
MEILGTAVLIKPDVLPERTKGGNLIIPRNSTEMLPELGTIIECGTECDTYKKGDYVQFPRKTASVIVIDGEDHFITNEHKLFFGKEKGEDNE